MSEAKSKDTRLDGLQAIADYLERSVKSARDLIVCEGMPATKLGGEWSSDKDLIDDWRKKKILKETESRPKKRREVKG